MNENIENSVIPTDYKEKMILDYFEKHEMVIEFDFLEGCPWPFPCEDCPFEHTRPPGKYCSDEREEILRKLILENKIKRVVALTLNG